MRLSLHLQRCPLGRSARMLPKAEDTTVGVGMEAAGGAMIITLKVAVEDMKEVEEEEDMETGEAEEEVPEEGRCREAGEMELEEGEAVIRATIMMQEVIRGEEGEVVMEEGTIKEASRTLATMEEEALTMKATTKM